MKERGSRHILYNTRHGIRKEQREEEGQRYRSYWAGEEDQDDTIGGRAELVGNTAAGAGGAQDFQVDGLASRAEIGDLSRVFE